MDQVVAPLPPIVLAHQPAFRIGPVEVRPETCELLPPASPPVILEPRVMQVLVALAEARGHVVSRDDLLLRCWPGRIVGDDAVHRVLSRLRHDAERAGGHFRIETITKVGYRLIEANGDARSIEASGPGESQRLNRRTILLGGGAIAATAAMGGFAWEWNRRPALPPAAAAKLAEGRSAGRMGNMQAALTALAAFREAVALAPNHAEPWGALAIAYAYQFVRGSPSEAAANERQAKASMARALAIDPDNGDALQAGLAIDFAKGLPLAEVERRLDTALRRASDKSGLTDMRCFFFSQVGRDRAALSAFDQRMRIALPMSAPNEAARGYLLWGVGRTVEADQLLTRLMEQWPRHISVWFTLQKMLTYSGRYDRALALIDDVERRPLGVPEWNFELSRQQTLGLADPAAHRERALAMNRESARRGSGFAVNAMIYFSAVGRVDEAFEVADALYFGKGFIVPNQRFTAEQGSFDSRRRLTGYLFEPATATMRADPRFTGMTERLRLGAYWRESGSRPDYLA